MDEGDAIGKSSEISHICGLQAPKKGAKCSTSLPYSGPATSSMAVKINDVASKPGGA
jgi:hypothetical protein